MARATYVKAAAKDYPEHGIKKGEPYYWWKFRYGGKHYSKTKPKASQLTQSAHLSAVYEAQEMINDAAADESLAETVESVIDLLSERRDECDSSLSNMPEGLQEGDIGQLLQSRIDAMESAIDELESIDLEFDPDGVELPERQDGETDEDYEARCEEAKDEAEESFWQEKLEEVQGVSIDTE